MTLKGCKKIKKEKVMTVNDGQAALVLSLDCVQAPWGASKHPSVTDAVSLWALPDALLARSLKQSTLMDVGGG